ncbi:hypothetical protein [Bradyrhizobium sp. SZCCHNR2011]|uniref:hypothetical protein n=1 Tax=Bradyrhizobium sp. SZCCHNR2011 TaxID=3057376 RepID=UPI0028E42A78|nr:hypothetical protein [Bradyrhizobium sp. SZCCHNR2011]
MRATDYDLIRSGKAQQAFEASRRCVPSLTSSMDDVLTVTRIDRLALSIGNLEEIAGV